MKKTVFVSLILITTVLACNKSDDSYTAADLVGSYKLTDYIRLKETTVINLDCLPLNSLYLYADQTYFSDTTGNITCHIALPISDKGIWNLLPPAQLVLNQDTLGIAFEQESKTLYIKKQIGDTLAIMIYIKQ